MDKIFKDRQEGFRDGQKYANLFDLKESQNHLEKEIKKFGEAHKDACLKLAYFDR